MKKNRFFLSGLLAVSLAGVLLAGCGGQATPAGVVSAGSEAEAADVKELEDITLALMVNTHALPMFEAQQGGFMEANGLKNIDYIYFSNGATENEALGSNEWEVGSLGNMAAVAGGIAYNSHIIAAICNEDNACDCWVRPDSDIANIKGEIEGYPNMMGNAEVWKGKTILVPTTTGAHYALGKGLEAIGLSLSDVQLISMDVSQCLTAFQAGQADAMMIWSPTSYLAEEAGFVKAFGGSDLGLTVPSYMVASEKALREKPEEVAACLKACFEAIDQYYDDPEARADYLSKMSVENGIEYDTEMTLRDTTERPNITLEENIKYFEGEYGEREIDVFLGDVIDFLVEQGLYTEEDKQSLIDNNFIDSTIIDMIAAE